jgi:hypothetical protein
MKNYLVIRTNDDGECYGTLYTATELQERLDEDYWGENPNFLTPKDVGVGDFVNSGPRGLLIIETSGIVIPKPKQQVTKWEL